MDFVKKLLLGPDYDAWPGKGPIRTWPADDSFKAKVAAIAFEPHGDDGVDVVGSDACRELIEPILAGRRAARDPNPEHMAFLIPEPSNAADPDAIRVIVGSSKPGGPSGKVGYLSHADALAYRPVIDRLAARGRVVACRSTIVEAEPEAQDQVPGQVAAAAPAGTGPEDPSPAAGAEPEGDELPAVHYSVRLRLAPPAALLAELGLDA